jgi:3-hydroxymyristoyl/3-hydroxydecanoyl-(acyl carrier protein) dehydratase/1-acyl-sn-glycerol-3-phosphate acyltransferase
MYLGCKLLDDTELFFRNLDGQGVVEGEVMPASGTLKTRAKLIQVSRSPGIILVGFSVECHLGAQRVYTLKTVFGFFPPESLAAQVGLPLTDADRQTLAAPSDFRVDLTTRPARYCQGPLRLAEPMLLMLDRVTGYWPTGGKAGLGRWRAEKDVNAAEWFFKAHFYQDPVQPGSLGVQAMLQLVQFALLEHGAGHDLVAPRFCTPAASAPHAWKYRGQVTPRSRRITVEVELLELTVAGPQPMARAEAWLYVDGLRIYYAKDLVVRVVADPAKALPDPDPRPVLSIDNAREFWLSHLGVPLWPGAEILLSLVERFVGQVTVAEPAAFPALRQRGVLILANHQVQVESLLLPILLASALGRPVVTLADARHEARWLGQLARLIFSYPGVKNPDTIRYFDQEDRASLLRLVEGFRQDLKSGQRSVMVHVEGRLGLGARQPVEQMSSLFLDLALSADVPILPVRFARGLPLEPMAATRDFPIGYGRQDYHLGRILWPDELRALPYAERKRRVLSAINATGPALAAEEPAAPDDEFSRDIAAWQERTGGSEAPAVLLQALLRGPELATAETKLLAAAVTHGELQVPPGAAAEWTQALARWLFGPSGPRVRS